MNRSRISSIWVISDGAAGNVRQATALAEQLGDRYETLTLSPRAPWRWLAPHRLPGWRWAFGPDVAQRLQAPWPALAIGCGRQAALALRLIRTLGPSHCRTVQILDPRISSQHFDLVIAPEHDGLHGSNVITLQGSLNPIDDHWLTQARTAFADLATLPAPRYALLLGGPTRALALDQAYWNGLVTQLTALLESTGGTLMIASSRRTPDWLKAAARQQFTLPHCRHWHDERDGENPYRGFLAWADALIVTPDSVNMLSEAAATHAPLWSYAPIPLRGKLRQFVTTLHQADRLRFLGEPAVLSITPLRETPRVAAEVKTRLFR